MKTKASRHSHAVSFSFFESTRGDRQGHIPPPTWFVARHLQLQPCLLVTCPVGAAGPAMIYQSLPKMAP